MSTLRFCDVGKSFADTRVLEHLDFSVGKGEVYGLLGPNGSGKSTAINILCNLLDADSGCVEIDGQPASRVARTAIGVCPQEIALYRDLYPDENLLFFANLYGLRKAEATRRVGELMRLFGLERFRRTRSFALSGGWQRRLNIAAAIVHSPAIVVLDEPTSAIDVEARYELWETIEALKRSGMTILLTTHHLDEAEQLCTRIGIMKDGRIAEQGTVAELLALVPAKAVALVEAPDANALQVRAMALGWGVRHYAGRVACLLPKQVSLEELVRDLSGLGVSSVTLQRVSLEHAYIEVMHSGAPTGRALRPDTGDLASAEATASAV